MMSDSQEEATAGVVPVEGFNSSNDGPTRGKRGMGTADTVPAGGKSNDNQQYSSNGANNGGELADATATAPKHHGFLEKVGGGVLSLVGLGGSKPASPARAPASAPPAGGGAGAKGGGGGGAEAEYESDAKAIGNLETDPPAQEEDHHVEGPIGDGGKGKTDEHPESRAGILDRVGGGVYSLVGLGGAAKPEAARRAEAEPGLNVSSEGSPARKDAEDHLPPTSIGAGAGAAEEVREGKGDESPESTQRPGFLRKVGGGFMSMVGAGGTPKAAAPGAEPDLVGEGGDQIPGSVEKVQEGGERKIDESQESRSGIPQKVEGDISSIMGANASKPGSSGADPQLDAKAISERDPPQEANHQLSSPSGSAEKGERSINKTQVSGPSDLGAGAFKSETIREEADSLKADADKGYPLQEDEDHGHLPSSGGGGEEGNKRSSDEIEGSKPGILGKVGGGVLSMVGLGDSNSATAGEDGKPDSKSNADRDPLDKAADAAISAAAGVKAERDVNVDSERDARQGDEDRVPRSIGSMEEGDEQNIDETQTSKPGILEKVGGGVFSMVGLGGSKSAAAGAEPDVKPTTETDHVKEPRGVSELATAEQEAEPGVKANSERGFPEEADQRPSSFGTVEERNEGKIDETQGSRPGLLEKVGDGVLSKVGLGGSESPAVGEEGEPESKAYSKRDPVQAAADAALSAAAGVKAERDVHADSEWDSRQEDENQLSRSTGSVDEGDGQNIDETQVSKPGILDRFGGGVLSMVGLSASKPAAAGAEPDVKSTSETGNLKEPAGVSELAPTEKEVKPGVKANSERDFPVEEDQRPSSVGRVEEGSEGKIDETQRSRPGLLEKGERSINETQVSGPSDLGAHAFKSEVLREEADSLKADAEKDYPLQEDDDHGHLPSSVGGGEEGNKRSSDEVQGSKPGILGKVGAGVLSKVGLGGSESPTVGEEGEPDSKAYSKRDPVQEAADASISAAAEVKAERDLNADSGRDFRQEANPQLRSSAGRVDEGGEGRIDETQESRPGTLEKVGGGVLSMVGAGAPKPTAGGEEAEPGVKANGERQSRQEEQELPRTVGNVERGGEGNINEAKEPRPGVLEKIGGGAMSAVGLGASKSAAAGQEAEPGGKPSSERDFLQDEDQLPSSARSVEEGDEGRNIDETQESTPGLLGKVGGGVLSMVGLGASKSEKEAKPEDKTNLEKATGASKLGLVGESAEESDVKATPERDLLQDAPGGPKSTAGGEAEPDFTEEAERDVKADLERYPRQETAGDFKSAATEKEGEPGVKADLQRDFPLEEKEQLPNLVGGVEEGDRRNLDRTQEEEAGPYSKAHAGRDPVQEAADAAKSAASGVKAERGVDAGLEMYSRQEDEDQHSRSVGSEEERDSQNLDQTQVSRPPGVMEKVGGGVLSMVGLGAAESAVSGKEPDPDSERDPLRKSGFDSKSAAAGEKAYPYVRADSEKDLQQEAPGLTESLPAREEAGPGVSEKFEPDIKASSGREPLQEPAVSSIPTEAGEVAEPGVNDNLEPEFTQEGEAHPSDSVRSVEKGDGHLGETQDSRPGILQKVGGGVLSMAGLGASKSVAPAGEEVEPNVEAKAKRDPVQEADHQLPTSAESLEKEGERNVPEAEQSRPGVLEKVGGGVLAMVGAGDFKPAGAGAEFAPDVKAKSERDLAPEADRELPTSTGKMQEGDERSMEKTQEPKPGVLEKVGGGVLSMVGANASAKDPSQEADHQLPSSRANVAKGVETNTDDAQKSSSGIVGKVGGSVMSMVERAAAAAAAAAAEVRANAKAERDAKAAPERRPAQDADRQLPGPGASVGRRGEAKVAETKDSGPGVLEKIGGGVSAVGGAVAAKSGLGGKEAKPDAKAYSERDSSHHAAEGQLPAAARSLEAEGEGQTAETKDSGPGVLEKIGGGVMAMGGAAAAKSGLGGKEAKPDAKADLERDSFARPDAAEGQLPTAAGSLELEGKRQTDETRPGVLDRVGAGVMSLVGAGDSKPAAEPQPEELSLIDGVEKGQQLPSSVLEKIGGGVMSRGGAGDSKPAAPTGADLSLIENSSVGQTLAEERTRKEKQPGVGVAGEAEKGTAKDGKPGFLEKVGGGVLGLAGLGGAKEAAAKAEEEAKSASSPRKEGLSKAQDMDRGRVGEGLPQSVEYPEEVGPQQQQARSPSDSLVGPTESAVSRRRGEKAPKPKLGNNVESAADKEPKAFEKDVEEIPTPAAADYDQQFHPGKGEAHTLREKGGDRDASGAARAAAVTAAADEEEKMRAGNAPEPVLEKEPSLRVYIPKEGGGESRDHESAAATPRGTPLVHRVEQMEQKHPPSPINQSTPSSLPVPLSQGPGGESRDWSAPARAPPQAPPQAQAQQQQKSEMAESVNSVNNAKAPSDPIKSGASVASESPDRTGDDPKQKRSLKAAAGKFKSCFVGCVRPNRNQAD